MGREVQEPDAEDPALMGPGSWPSARNFLLAQCDNPWEVDPVEPVIGSPVRMSISSICEIFSFFSFGPEGGVICSMNNIVIRDPMPIYMIRVGFVFKFEIRVCFKNPASYCFITILS